MHGFMNCLHKPKKSSRETSPPSNKKSDEKRSTQPSAGSSKGSVQNEQSSIKKPIVQRRNSGQESVGHSPPDHTGSPPWQEEARGLPSHHRRYPLSRVLSPFRGDCPGPSSATNRDRHSVTPLCNDVMDAIQENDHNNELYGEISTDKLDHRPHTDRFENKNVSQQLVKCSKAPQSNPSTRERRESEGGSVKHKQHSIQNLIRSFGKKMSSWRRDSTGRRDSTEIRDSNGRRDSTERRDLTGRGDSTEKGDSTGRRDSTEKGDSTGRRDSTEKGDSTGRRDSTEKGDSTGRRDSTEKGDSTGRRDSTEKGASTGRHEACAVRATTVDVRSKEKSRRRYKSLEPNYMQSIVPHPILDDVGATYRIYDAIIQQGVELRRERAREAAKRRSSLDNCSGDGRHRGSNTPYSERLGILYRDSRGIPVLQPFIEVSPDGTTRDDSQIFVKFFRFHQCYDLIPTSAKLVVFDIQLHAKKAFFALVSNGVRAAPLWDSEKGKFVGMLTITDFIKILQMNYMNSGVAMEELENHSLYTWRDLLNDLEKPLVSIKPDDSLYDAIYTIINKKIHRLPVIDPATGDVLYIITHKRILRFLFLYINDLPKPSYVYSKLRDLDIGTMSNIETATEDTTIIEALHKFVNRRVSALPVVDSEGRLKDIYAKFDVINLAAKRTYNNLDVTIKQANKHRNEWFEGVYKCKLDEALYDVMKRIVKAEVHRLVVVDDEDKVIGIISLSDLLSYMVLRTGGKKTDKRPKEHASIEEADENEKVPQEVNVKSETDNQ